MGIITFNNLAESTSRTQTHVLTIPNLKMVNTVTVNTGSIAIKSSSGDKLTVEASGGVATRTVQTGGSYTPSDTKFVTGQTSSNYNSGGYSGTLSGYVISGSYTPGTSKQESVRVDFKGPVPGNFNSLATTINYSQNGYSGVLTRQSGYSDLGDNNYSTYYHGTVSTPAVDTRVYRYEGNVTKPASDTRTYQSYYKYNITVDYVGNESPTLVLSTENNKSLTHNATLVVNGSTRDADAGNVVNVKFQVDNSEIQAISTGISDGSTSMPYTRTLTFKDGNLYDGTKVLLSSLVANQTYSLKVWAEDDKGAISETQTRSFTVIPNRPPTITINPVSTTSNLINNDNITISGKVEEPEGQNIVLKYKVNTSEYTQVLNGAPGNFSFVVKLGNMSDGDNIIQLEASDTYNATTIKKLKVAKTHNAQPLLQSVARYRVSMPAGGASTVVTWLEHQGEELNLSMAASMKQAGETEAYAPMELTNSVGVNGASQLDPIHGFSYANATDEERAGTLAFNSTGIGLLENEYTLQTSENKTQVHLKINMSKSQVSGDVSINKITGTVL